MLVLFDGTHLMEVSEDEETSGADDDNDGNWLWTNYRESYVVDYVIVGDRGNPRKGSP